MQERDLRIDCVKLIATIMVVILHVVEPGGGTQQCVYLLGTFGIPLFLAVNGWLMYGRTITFSYFAKKFTHYFRFVALWSIVMGSIESVIKRRFVFIDVFVGAWMGRGRLFHLWFITTILLILGLHSLLNALSKQKAGEHPLLRAKWMIALILLMNLLFIVNMFFYYTGGVIIAPFRLLTNGGFYLLGMYLHSVHRNLKRSYLIFITAAGYTAICVFSIVLSVEWASQMYASVFCIAGTLSLMAFCLQLKVTDNAFWRIVRMATPASVGTWATHPFVLAAARKVLSYMGIEYTLGIRILMLPTVFMVCLFGVSIGLRIKGIRMWFQI